MNDIKKRIERVNTNSKRVIGVIYAFFFIFVVVVVALLGYFFLEYTALQDNVWGIKGYPENAEIFIVFASLMFFWFHQNLIFKYGLLYSFRLYEWVWKKYFLKEFPEIDRDAIEKTVRCTRGNRGQRFLFPVIARAVLRQEPEYENEAEENYLKFLNEK